MLYQLSGRDTLVVADAGRRHAQALCDAGYRTDLRECAGASHTQGAIDRLPVKIRWLRDRLDGVALQAICDLDEVRTRSVAD